MTKIFEREQSSTIQIHLPDGRTLEGPRGASAEEFLDTINLSIQPPPPIEYKSLR